MPRPRCGGGALSPSSSATPTGRLIGGAIPVPLANAAAITALMVRMIKSLSELYGVPFERNRTRAIVIGLMGGALPTGFATVATSTLTYFVPGYESAGPRGVLGDVVSLCPQHRPVVHRAFRERGHAVDFRSIILN